MLVRTFPLGAMALSGFHELFEARRTTADNPQEQQERAHIYYAWKGRGVTASMGGLPTHPSVKDKNSLRGPCGRKFAKWLVTPKEWTLITLARHRDSFHEE